MESDLTSRRWVKFAEIDNARDLGGLPVQGGGATRFGVVYRSSTPQQLSESDLAYLLGPVGLRTLVDLRTPLEVTQEGYGRLAESAVRLVNLPVCKAASTAAPSELVPDAHRFDLRQLYHELLSGSAGSVVSAARLIGDARRHSVVFHCAAGKDRTGILAAMLLDAVGVHAEAVVADYALTAERIVRIRARLDALHSYRGLPPVRTGILDVDPAPMRRFLRDLHTDHGGAARWLRANGLTDLELAALRRAMVEQS
ncbi:tyrosine-protein phosphatase [Nocardia suismassiliense]|uniref:Tyrosine-protein phosphatase n=1 Tax=Nocardia suismassiliense TaxID=2077092 RepID=A0ABW6R213_9NOCA